MGAFPSRSEMPPLLATVKDIPLIPWVALFLFTMTSISCGPERDFTGIWQQTQCGDNPDQADCDGFLYALHIGRYGDAVTGMVVRYRFDETAFDGFRATAECGCFLIDSGRAEEDRFEFRIFEPSEPRTRAVDGTLEPACAAAAECPGRRFILEDTDDGLVGQLVCEDGSATPIRFDAAIGSPRTQCSSATP